MRITTVLFDLDGTLLPMDQDVFLKAYFGGLVKKLAPHGYDPEKLVRAIWAGTGAMVKNDGRCSNEEVFWRAFEAIFGTGARQDEPIFRHFYENEFQQVRQVCGFNPEAAQTVAAIKEMGLRVALATNPLFPAVATESRIRWAGLEPGDFELFTVYENSCHCKPNPDYYRDVCARLDVRPEECLMVGNDAEEDLIAESLGMKVFLLTDCLINKHNKDISSCSQGGFGALMDYIRGLE